MISLSKNEISSYVGDIVPLRLEGEDVDRSSDVVWSVDGNAATLRTFVRDSEHAAKSCVLVCLMTEGTATVRAEYAGTVYTVPVKVRPMSHADSDSELNYYFADLHDHTSPIHNHDLFAKHETEDITDYINFIKNDPIDLSVISDHGGVTNDYDFFRGFELAESCDSTVILAGAESEVKYTETDRYGVLHRHSGEIVTLMCRGYGKVETWGELEAEIGGSPAPVAVFPHPNIVGFSTNSMWNFDFRRNASPTMLNAVRGIETVNGGDFEENLTYEHCYSAALDAGFRVSSVASCDSHGPTWGYGYMTQKTVIMAKENNKEAFHDALRSNRFYATESGNVKLSYSVNGKTAPTDLEPTDEYRFHIELDSFRDDPTTVPVRCQIISDYGKTAAEAETVGRSLDITVRSDSARYFYLRLTDGMDRHTWSYPVWCGRPFDTLTETKLTPIDMSVCSATSNGIPADTVINGAPLDSWHSGEPRPRVVIDMGDARDISGFGYYPHMILRDPAKGPNWRVSHEARSIVTEYRLSSSLDGESYTAITEQRSQYLGDENIIGFTPHSARYLAFEVLSTVGADSGRRAILDSEAVIGNLTIFE